MRAVRFLEVRGMFGVVALSTVDEPVDESSTLPLSLAVKRTVSILFLGQFVLPNAFVV